MRLLHRIQHTLEHRFNPTTPLITVSISRENLLHNLHAYQHTYPSLQFAPVLKSNAYGHGLCLVARALDDEHIAFFAVDSLYEAGRLRRDGVRSRILIIGYARPEDIARSRLRATDFGIVGIEQLRTLGQLAQSPVRLHLKLDTGMHRQGLLPEELTEAGALVRSNPNLMVVGMYSHFADADSLDTTHAHSQVERWTEALTEAKQLFPKLEYRHVAATKGAPLVADADTNVVRLGMGLYGYNTSPHEKMHLKPVLEMRSLIVSLRTVPAGESVGYNITYTAKRPTRSAVVPVGYFEGLDRRLSNRGVVLVRGHACPIIGRVSMNMVSIDVTEVPDVACGEPVIVLSRNPEDPNSAGAMAKLMSTDNYTETTYVLFAHIPEHLRRTIE